MGALLEPAEAEGGSGPGAGASVCDLCSLPAPEPPFRGQGALVARTYCCAGCAAVDEVLSALAPAKRAEARVSIARRAGLPEAQIRALEAAAATPGPGAPALVGREPAAGPEVVEERFRVDGLHCPSCSWLAEHLLRSQPGVLDARVDYLTEFGTIRLDLRRTSRETAFAALEPAGYRARQIAEVGADPERLALRASVAAIAAMNAMMLAFVHYAEVFGASAGPWKATVGFLGAAVALPSVAWAGAPIFKRAFGLLRRGQLAMESLLALGVLASMAISLAAFVLEGANFYFEIPTMIVATALGSRLIDRAIRRHGTRRVAALLRPRPVRVRTGTGFVRLDDLAAGQRIVVPAGEEVPADVEVLCGAVTVSEAVLTGEPRPVAKRHGDTVLAGSEVVEATGDERGLVGEVLRPARASACAQIGDQILAVVRGQSEGTALGDRIAGAFVVAVLLIAAATLAAHAWLGGLGWTHPGAWLPAIAVLVVACPCAFSIAASASMGTAAIRLLADGVLLRTPASLEKAAAARVVVFDKTGTLTAGDMDVVALDWLGSEPEPALLQAVAALEARSSHPMGAAIRRYLGDAQVTPAPAESVTELEEVRGLGVRATVAGRQVAVGAPRLFGAGEAEQSADGRSYVLFGEVGRPAGRFLFDDPLRPAAAEAIARLRALGVEARVLSGDDPAVVGRVARELGIESFEGRVLPRDKAERVEALRARGLGVVYVGDGVNDASALAAATVGIAMRHGASVALETADLLSIRDEPAVAALTIEVSRRLRRVTLANYAWAIGYNVLLVPVAALGLLHPAFAATAMLLSSLTVLANSARLLRSRRGTT